jgi:hypothetical protein
MIRVRDGRDGGRYRSSSRVVGFMIKVVVTKGVEWGERE